MHILIVTDAWEPQVNGVVRSLQHLIADGTALGARFSIISPQDYRSTPMPGYSEIRLALCSPAGVARDIERVGAEYIHIATEGPLGIMARRWCKRNKHPFTTGYHTKFPEYLRARLPVPTRVSYAWLRRFHNAGNGVLVPSRSMQLDLTARGFTHVQLWGRGVDTHVFTPELRQVHEGDPLPRPHFLYVGRVAVEKNIEAFLALNLPGTKIVVGDGPARARLQAQYPQVVFRGVLTNTALAREFASADVFVFPSKTDTFGLVILEALACGTPVAAYPVTGPIDIVENGVTGVLHDNLQAAALQALHISRTVCRNFAAQHSWRASAQQFLDSVKAAQELRK